MKKFCEVKVPNGPVTTTYTVERDCNGAVYISRNDSRSGGNPSYIMIDPSAITSIVQGLLMAHIQGYDMEVFV